MRVIEISKMLGIGKVCRFRIAFVDANKNIRVDMPSTVGRPTVKYHDLKVIYKKILLL